MEFVNEKPISNSYLLKLVDNLPKRFINILNNKKFYSEEDFFKMVEKLYSCYTSYQLFPNQLIAFYPQVVESHASKEITCHLSGAKIKQGNTYYIYHPFMENINNGKVYVIKKKIKCELGYQDLLPQNLSTYEEWYYRLKNAYYQDYDGPIDFYNLSTNLGDTCLEPMLLNNKIIQKRR